MVQLILTVSDHPIASVVVMVFLLFGVDQVAFRIVEAIEKWRGK